MTVQIIWKYERSNILSIISFSFLKDNGQLFYNFQVLSTIYQYCNLKVK